VKSWPTSSARDEPDWAAANAAELLIHGTEKQRESRAYHAGRITPLVADPMRRVAREPSNADDDQPFGAASDATVIQPGSANAASDITRMRASSSDPTPVTVRPAFRRSAVSSVVTGTSAATPWTATCRPRADTPG
jgi:hypothetical protein